MRILAGARVEIPSRELVSLVSKAVNVGESNDEMASGSAGAGGETKRGR